MAVIPWRAPGPDDPALAFLTDQINKAQQTLDAAVAEASALPLTEPSRSARLARYNALQREVQRTYDQVTRLTRGWATVDLPGIYAEGHLAAALQSRTAATFSLAHKEAVAVISADAYKDVATGLQQVPQQFNLKIAAQKQLELLSDNRRGLIQVASRDLVAQQLILGELSPADAARLLRDQLWKNGVEVIDRAGRRWQPETYSRMLIRTKSANAFNVGSLNKFRTDGISRVLVFDGVHDVECARANGQIWTTAYAYSHVIAHPNCRRAFAPQPGRGLLHRATLQETARFAALTVVDEALIGAFLRTVRSWDAVGQIRLIPPQLREQLDRFNSTAGALERLEYAEAWLTEQFMPVVEQIADLIAPGMGDRLKNLAIERLERRVPPLKRAELQLMADVPPAIPAPPQSQAARSAAIVVRSKLGTDDIANPENMLHPGLYGIDPDVDQALDDFLKGDIQIFELTDAMRNSGDAHLIDFAQRLDEASEADILGIVQKHFGNDVTTVLGGGANESIPVVLIGGKEWLIKHINATVTDVYPAFVAEEWGTYLARQLGLPRPDSALVRINEKDAATGLILQQFMSGWSDLNDVNRPDVHALMFRGTDAGRRMALLNILIVNMDAHNGNWLVSSGMTTNRQAIQAGQIMPIDLETAFNGGGGWQLAPWRPERPIFGPAEQERWTTIRSQPQVRHGPQWEAAIGPGVTPAESAAFATINLTPQENALLLGILRGEHDDVLIELASAVPLEDLARLPARYLHPDLDADRPWVPIVRSRIHEIKERIRRAYAVGYLDEGTRTMTFAGKELTVGEVAEFDLINVFPDPIPAPGPRPQNPLGVRNAIMPPILDSVEGTVWRVWEDVDGTKWVAIAHGLPMPTQPQQTWVGFVVVRESDVIPAGVPAPPVPVRVDLPPFIVEGDFITTPVRHDWEPSRLTMVDGLTDLQVETGIAQIQGVLEDVINDVTLAVPNSFAPAEVRLGRIEVDGVEVPGAYHPRGARDHEFLQELAIPGGVVINPEKLVDGLEGFWAAWKGGRTDDAVAALNTERFERVLRHELGHAVAEARAEELTAKVAEVAFHTITGDNEWMQAILGPNVEAAEAVRLLTHTQLRAAVQPEVDRYTDVVTGKIQSTLRDELRRVMQEKYGVINDTMVHLLPEWLRYAGHVFVGNHPGLDPLREFEGDLIGHLIERDSWDELSRLERLFTLTELPNMPASRQELTDIGDWLKEWYKENRPPSVGLQLMAEQTGLPKRRLQRIARLQDEPGSFTDEDVVRKVYEHDFGAFRTEVTRITPNIDGTRITVTGALYDNQVLPNPQAGSFKREITRNPDGTVEVYHAFLFMYKDYQGRGWGTEFFDYTEDWYVAKGVKEITVETTEIGNYNWARRGYGFRSPSKAVEILRPMEVINFIPLSDPEQVLIDYIDDLLLRTWLVNPEFVLDHIEHEGVYLDLWRFTEHVRDQEWYLSLPEATEELFLETFDALEWAWYGLREEDAIRARELYEIIAQRIEFEPTIASEAVRWAGMGAMPLPTRDVDGSLSWVRGINNWEQLVDTLYPEELEAFRRANVIEFTFVRDAVMHPSYRLAGPTQAFQALRRIAAERIETEWTPFRLSQIGAGLPFPDPARHGKESWLGKELMLRHSWEGVKPLDVLRNDFKEQVFRELRLHEIVEITPAFVMVNYYRDLEKGLVFVEDVLTRLGQVSDELMVRWNEITRETEVWERIGDEVRIIQRTPTRFVDDDAMVDYAMNVTAVRRQTAWFERPEERRAPFEWDVIVNGTQPRVVVEQTGWVSMFERAHDRFVQALADPDMTLRESKLLDSLSELGQLIYPGIPGYGIAAEYIGAFDSLNRVFRKLDNINIRQGLTVGDFMAPRLDVDTSPTRATPHLSDSWTRGTVVRDYAGATTYYAFNSQMRRERGIHNSSLAMQRALRRDYDQGPGYSYPGWELTFRQTSLTLDFWENLVGREWISEGYMSTAFSPRNIGGFAAGDESRHVMLVIRFPEELQRHARFINAGEAEVLFAPGSRFAVRGVFDGTIDGRFSEVHGSPLTPYSLVTMDYIHTAPRDVPAFGGWRAARDNFQYVSSVKRGESVRYRRRPSGTPGHPEAGDWVEAIVVGVTDTNITLVSFVDGRVQPTKTFPWTDIFQMDAAKPIALDPPIGPAAINYVEVDKLEFLRTFMPITDQGLTARANRIVRLELQTGQIVEGYIGRFAGGLTESRVITDQGIFELAWVRRFMYSVNEVPASSGYMTTYQQALRNLVLEIQSRLPDLGALMTMPRVAERFRDLATLLADNPNLLLNTEYTYEETMIVLALLGGHTTEFSIAEQSAMLTNSLEMRPLISKLLRNIDKFDGLGVFEDGMQTVITARLPELLKRAADALDADVLAPPVPPSIGGLTVAQPTKVAYKQVLDIFESMPLETPSGEVFELTLGEFIDNLEDFANGVDPGIMGGPIGTGGVWYELLLGGDEAILGDELFNDLKPVVAELILRLRQLANQAEAELTSQLGSMPSLQHVMVHLAYLLKNPDEVLGLAAQAPGVLQLPHMPHMTNTLIDLLDSINLVPMNIAVELQAHINDPFLSGNPVDALAVAIEALKKDTAENFNVVLGVTDWNDMPDDLQHVLLKLSEVFEIMVAPGMITQFDTVTQAVVWLDNMQLPPAAVAPNHEAELVQMMASVHMTPATMEHLIQQLVETNPTVTTEHVLDLAIEIHSENMESNGIALNQATLEQIVELMHAEFPALTNGTATALGDWFHALALVSDNPVTIELNAMGSQVPDLLMQAIQDANVQPLVLAEKLEEFENTQGMGNDLIVLLEDAFTEDPTFMAFIEGVPQVQLMAQLKVAAIDLDGDFHKLMALIRELDPLVHISINVSEDLVQKLADTLDEFDRAPGLVAEKLLEVASDGLGATAHVYVDVLFEDDVLKLLNDWAPDEIVKLYNVLIDATNDPAIHDSIGLLIQLLKEMDL